MTSLPIRAGIAAATAAGVLATAGCGSGSEAGTATAKQTRAPSAAAATPVAQTAAAQPAPAPVPAAMRGSWRRRMTAADWKPAGGGYPRGTWRVDIGRRGAMAVHQPRNPAVDFRTQLTADGPRATIDTVPICPTTKGRFTWKVAGRRLTLVTVKDPCGARDALFGGTWTRGR